MAIPGYRIVRKIRQGGMSTVYLAIQKSIGREVAIKVMSPSLSSDPSFGSRFYREAKIVGQLSHPHIISIYDVGSYKHYNYITMDYLPGAPLHDRLENGVTVSDAIRIVREVASALDYAHERGYIHRDIKPDNILFREDGSAVLCDFGIAKALKGAVKMTNIGSVLGTPHYMSPEQAQGKELDGRADLYSLGVVFYEMLAGQVPFTGDDAVAVAVKHMTSPIPKLPATHKAFQPIIEKMMAKRAADRFQTGREIIRALDELEETINSTGPGHLTHTGSTTVQMLGLAAALFSTLTTAVSMAFKRLMLTKITFASSTVQLSKKQLEDIDTFILADNPDGDSTYDDLPIIQDTIEQPAIGYNFRPLYYLLAILVIVAAGALYYVKGGHSVAATDIDHNITATEAPTPLPATPAEYSPETETAEMASTPSEQTPVAVEPAPVQVVEYALTIHTEPVEAKVRILNIKPRYKPGIMLPPGNYHIAVSAQDYLPQKRWLKIVDSNITQTIALEPTRRLLRAGSKIVDTLSSGGDAPAMVVIPKGELTLNDGKKTLSVNEPLAFSIYEVTFADYLRFVNATKLTEPEDHGWGKDNHPVISVSYNDAVAYTTWLSEQTGQKYRLPTRSEWEYAARAGSTGSYWWEEDDAIHKANCRRGCKSDYSKLFGSSTAPVGSYAANAFGLYDTAGNVEEWLQECTNWQDDNKTTCQSAKVAGGSHADWDKEIHPDSVKSANATEGSKTIGFRLVLEL